MHIPVLLKEVIDYLNPGKNENFIDATLGLGGYTAAILEKNKPNGKVLAIEWDTNTLKITKEKLKKDNKRIIFVKDNFANLQSIANSNLNNISGIVFDLGLSSYQIDQGSYGLSYKTNQPLDMKFGLGSNEKFIITAKDIINKHHEKEIANILYQYGDIGNSYKIAKNIVNFRQKQPILTTYDLKKAIGSDNPKLLSPIFQALRIKVNNELDNLQKALSQALKIIKPGARIVVISYHSGEDRIVKNFFRDNKQYLKIITKKPITPSWAEIKNNSRSRSAKLRSAIKLED
jgi:16S rRNA (cytosine1402-N4)-methyltransferase